MPDVYITNAAGHDFTKAEKYGELKWITKGWVLFGSLDRLKYQIVERLKETTKDDYLLLSGTQVICVIAALVWYNKHGCVKLLVHDKKNSGSYRELIVSEKNLNDIMELVQDGPRDDRTQGDV